ncbi:MAG: hypothetical protein AB8H86_27560 [Polyangiales bacterium]
MRPLLLLVLCSCSAVISPDPDLLGGGDFDGGPGPDAPRVDAGPGSDSGRPPFDAGRDAGPPVDAGPGCEGRPPRCEGANFVTCVEGADVSRPCPSTTMCDVDFGGCRPFDECPGGAPICRDGASFQCTGAPVYTRVDCERGCEEATGLCADGLFRPSNLTRDAFDESASDVVLPMGSFVLDTDVCEVTSGGFSRIQPTTSGGEACVWRVGNVDMSESLYLGVSGSLPLIVIATGDVNLDGFFDLRADGNIPGAGGFAGGSRDAPAGRGDGGGLPGMRAGDFGDGGGGGGGGLSAGGRGGDAGASAFGGAGGASFVTTGEPLIGGSGGGVGPGAPGREGNGGGGGGAIQISALGTVTVRGVIRAGGGGGQGGISFTNESNWGSGGGGGAGGTILLEAPRVVVEGNLSVSGGGGGGGPSNRSNGNDNGDDGPTEGTARGAQNGTDGGDGGGRTPEDGDSSDNGNGNGGGGGGSAGFVILRGEDILVEGNLNPEASTQRRPL